MFTDVDHQISSVIKFHRVDIENSFVVIFVLTSSPEDSNVGTITSATASPTTIANGGWDVATNWTSDTAAITHWRLNTHFESYYCIFY